MSVIKVLQPLKIHTHYNRPVSHRLNYLRNINDHQLTVVVQHLHAIWKPLNVQKRMGSKLFTTIDAQTIINIFIIITREEQ